MILSKTGNLTPLTIGLIVVKDCLINNTVSVIDGKFFERKGHFHDVKDVLRSS